MAALSVISTTPERIQSWKVRLAKVRCASETGELTIFHFWKSSRSLPTRSRLDLNECSLGFAWRYPEIEIKDIAIEEKEKFRIQGEISIKRRVLRGTIRLGLTREYLDWLPNPEEVFSRRSSGYLWTDVRLSGTIDKPKQDLSQRIIELFKESPGAYLGLIFRQFGDWLKKTFGD